MSRLPLRGALPRHGAPSSRAARLVVAIGAGVLVAGCGGGTAGVTGATDPEPVSPQDAVTATVEQMFTTADAGDCTALYTRDALTQMLGTDDPVAACREALPATPTAGSVQVEQVEVAEQRASARATPDGGEYAGLAVTTDLVQVEGAWRIDRLTDLELLDRDVVLAPISAGLQESAGNSLNPKDIDCIEAVIGLIEDDEVERLILERQMGQRGIDALNQCMGAGQDLLTMFRLLNNQLLNADVSEADSACIAGYMTGFFQDWTIESAMTDPTYPQQRDAEILRVVEEHCTP